MKEVRTVESGHRAAHARRGATAADTVSDLERSFAMKLSRSPMVIVLALSSLATCFSSGCQTTVGGQTLPSAYYLKDDIQYFPPGSEFKLSKQVAAIEEYKASQAGLADALQPAAP
jgi:hypothetical protein